MHFKFTCFFVHLSVYLQIHLFSGCNQDSSEEFLNLRDWNKCYSWSCTEFHQWNLIRALSVHLLIGIFMYIYLLYVQCTLFTHASAL